MNDLSHGADVTDSHMADTESIAQLMLFYQFEAVTIAV